MNQELLNKYADEWKQIGEYQSSFGPAAKEPLRNFPITERENFEKLFRGEKPVYMPSITDMLAFSPAIVPDHRVRAWALEIADPVLPGGQCDGGPDMFGVEWVYIPITGGSMVRGDNPKIKDISHWEDYITFPDLDSWDWEGSAKGNAALFNDRRMNRIWLMNGLNERMLSLMNFADVMQSYVDEDMQEGVHRFFDKLCTFYDDLFERYRKYYHCDVIMFNDDWGTQRGPQFSPDTAREMLMPYVRRLVESCHKRGMYFEIHSCGKNDIIAPVFAECGIDIWLPQENINDFALLYELIGDKVKLGIPTDSTPDMSDEEAWVEAERFMERYGNKANVIANTTFPPQHPRMAEFLYCLSREEYAK